MTSTVFSEEMLTLKKQHDANSHLESLPHGMYLFLLLLYSILIVFCVAQTLDWQIGWDASPIQYTAGRILQGDRLYEDIFDVSWPGSILVHMAAIGIFGRADLGFRLFDLAWICFLCVSIFLFFGKTRWRGAAAASLCTIACYLAAGETNMQEREIQMLPFLILALHFTGLSIERNRKVFAILSGFFLGFVVYIKPFPVVLLALLIAFVSVVYALRSDARSLLAGVGLLVGSFLIPSALIHAWLWRMDAVQSFWHLMVAIHYRLYRTLYNSAPSVILSSFAMWTLPAWPVAVGMFLARKLDLRMKLLLTGVAYGLFHYFYQGKGWSQHIYIVAIFLLMAGFYSIDLLLRGQRHGLRYVAVALAAGTLLLTSPVYLMSLDRLKKHDLTYVESAMEDLKHLLRAGDEVQPLENMAGLINAMYRLNLRIPARYWHSYPFFHSTGNAKADQYLQSMKEDFIARLSKEKVRIIIIDHNDLPEIDRQFPALAELLAEKCFLYKSNGFYAIYLKRGGSHA
jgi:hypothetical protein